MDNSAPAILVWQKLVTDVYKLVEEKKITLEEARVVLDDASEYASQRMQQCYKSYVMDVR